MNSIGLQISRRLKHTGRGNELTDWRVVNIRMNAQLMAALVENEPVICMFRYFGFNENRHPPSGKLFGIGEDFGELGIGARILRPCAERQEQYESTQNS
jgi:hypothetical protein